MKMYGKIMNEDGKKSFPLNEETGKIWLERSITQWPSYLWINPLPRKYWGFSESTNIIKEIFSSRMVTLSIEGIENGIELLTKNK